MIKLNIANPATGCQKLVMIEDEHKVRMFWEKRIAEEFQADFLGDDYKGYVFKITGGHDKQGFPMKQGVLTADRVRLLLSETDSCYNRYHGQKRKGARRRKSVRGCIAGPDTSILHLIIVKKGDKDIEGVTEPESAIPNRLGPKRANNIRKLFNLTKEDDVRQYVIRREIPVKEGSNRTKPRTKAPKIQRLVTPRTLQHKRHRLALKKRRDVKARTEAAAYAKLIASRKREARSKRESRLSSKRQSRKSTKA
mmetsp:Transcript_112428/g.157639  ORF Transcript_112428/g.157639 Transcript_112428/m.157639 type:complete len:252 (+) Transcript_112428:19-774(+)